MALIEREAAEKEALIKKVESMTAKQFYRFIMTVCGAYLQQDAAPVVHGRVLDNGNPICGPCSVCGESTNRRARYCSMCGARMDGGDGHE